MPPLRVYVGFVLLPVTFAAMVIGYVGWRANGYFFGDKAKVTKR